MDSLTKANIKRAIGDVANLYSSLNSAYEHSNDELTSRYFMGKAESQASQLKTACTEIINQLDKHKQEITNG